MACLSKHLAKHSRAVLSISNHCVSAGSRLSLQQLHDDLLELQQSLRLTGLDLLSCLAWLAQKVDPAPRPEDVTVQIEDRLISGSVQAPEIVISVIIRDDVSSKEVEVALDSHRFAMGHRGWFCRIPSVGGGGILAQRGQRTGGEGGASKP